jgi:hypothetical protein
MKRTDLLLLGLALLPPAVQAAPISVCVEALEQLKTLHMAAPVYKLNEGQERRYLADADRPAEVDRLKTIVAESCSAEPETRARQGVWEIATHYQPWKSRSHARRKTTSPGIANELQRGVQTSTFQMYGSYSGSPSPSRVIVI